MRVTLGDSGESGNMASKELDSLNNNHEAKSKEDGYHSDKQLPAPKKRGRPRKKAKPENAHTGDIAEDLSNTSEDELRRKVPRKRKTAAAPATVLEVPQIVSETKLLAAGDGEVGQLGIGEDGESGKPRFVAVCALGGKSEVQPKAVRCAAGAMHSLVLTSKGDMYSFGCNDDGTLGRVTAEEKDCFVPGRVDIPDNFKVSKIAVGNVHNVALTTNGRVLLWGIYRDSNGPLGIDPKSDKAEPIRKPNDITSLVPERIIDVACGADHTLLLSNEGNVFSMGCAEQGRLGRIRRSHCCRQNRRGQAIMLSPGLVVVISRRKSVKFNRIWAGRYTSFARSEDGTIWGCGLNNFKQLGPLKASEMQDHCAFLMVRLHAFDPKIRWVDIVSGEQHTLALDDTGRVFAMGRVLYGRLGLGKADANDPDVTALTPLPDLEDITAIAAGDHTSFALNKRGSLFSWGQGTNMLGQGDREVTEEQDLFTPTVCTSKVLKSSNVVHISAGSNHSLCIVTPRDLENNNG
ncbi:regulator of chromosome condensation-like [Tropilaelaps mercedesae]|uniref:Regulator of chromosome condensation-like n=1 Tax=Tropilaelaps mercedesae TaxID=418985 RepID=A0A1V9XSH8_9ACAR|nr:regulator of chromosome condensation-like [Tropilaelaps mercedesae]